MNTILCILKGKILLMVERIHLRFLQRFMGELGYFFYDNQIGFSQLYNLVRIFARMDHLIEIVALHTIKFNI